MVGNSVNRELLFVLICAKALLIIYVDQSVLVPLPNGSIDAPFPDFTVPLLNSADELEIQLLPHETPNSYALSSIGKRTMLMINCTGNGVTALAPILVLQGTSVTFEDCLLTSSFSGSQSSFLLALGTASISRSLVTGLRTFGFTVFGTLELTESRFQSNMGSLIVTNVVGWTVIVTNCTFEDNFSSVGSVFALHPTQEMMSPSLLQVRNCEFLYNTAVMGGSVMLFMVDDAFQLLEDFQHQVMFQNCTFLGNSGYAFLVYLKYFSFYILSSNFTNHDYVLILIEYGGVLTVSDTVVTTVKGFLQSNHIAGLIQLNNMQITDVTIGPTVLCFHSTYTVQGTIYIHNMTITNPNLIDPEYRSATFFFASVYGVIDGLVVKGGYSHFTMAGTYSSSLYHISNVEIYNATVWGAGLIAFFGSSGTITNITAHDSTVQTISWLSMYLSDVNVTGVNIWAVYTPYQMFGKAAYTVITLFNSRGNFTNVRADLPHVPSSPLFYADVSELILHNVTVPYLGGWLMSCYYNSSGLMENALVEEASAAGIFEFYLYSQGYVKHVEITSAHFSQSFMNVERSSVYLEGASLNNSRFESLVSSTNSNCIVKQVQLFRVFAEVLFPRQIGRYECI